MSISCRLPRVFSTVYFISEVPLEPLKQDALVIFLPWFGWTPGVGDGQGGQARRGSRGRKESDATEQLN